MSGPSQPALQLRCPKKHAYNINLCNTSYNNPPSAVLDFLRTANCNCNTILFKYLIWVRNSCWRGHPKSAFSKLERLAKLTFSINSTLLIMSSHGFNFRYLCFLFCHVTTIIVFFFFVFVVTTVPALERHRSTAGTSLASPRRTSLWLLREAPFPHSHLLALISCSYLHCSLITLPNRLDDVNCSINFHLKRS